MGRITFGDVVFGGVLAFLIGLVVSFSVGFLIISLFSVSSIDEYTLMFLIMFVFFLAGGLLLGVTGRRAGYPVLTTWAWGVLAILTVASFFIFIGVVVLGGALTAGLFEGLVAIVATLVSWMFFAVSLAAFLNARGQGLPQNKTYGSVPGQFGAYIYKSNQPAIYEGVKDLDLEVKAPGSLYRQRR